MMISKKKNIKKKKKFQFETECIQLPFGWLVFNSRALYINMLCVPIFLFRTCSLSFSLCAFFLCLSYFPVGALVHSLFISICNTYMGDKPKAGAKRITNQGKRVRAGVKVSFTFRLLVCCCLFRMLFLLKKTSSSSTTSCTPSSYSFACVSYSKSKNFFFLSASYFCLFFSSSSTKCVYVLITYVNQMHVYTRFFCFFFMFFVSSFGTRGHIFSAEL